MQSNKLGKGRLQKEYQRLQKNPVPNIEAHPDPTNIYNWNFILYGLEAPYKGGYYHGKIVFPVEYPMKPPKLMFLTPNGRFQLNTQICMSFTNFHPESWNPLWGVENMLIGIISFMFTDEITTGGEKSTDIQKQQFADKSLSFNLDSPQFVQNFKTLFDKLGIKNNQLEIKEQK